MTQNSGQITSAQIMIDHNGPAVGDFVISIVPTPGGVPSDTVLASATIPDASIPEEAGVTLMANFTTPPPVIAGEQFALVITRPGSNQMDVLARDSDADCLGTLFFSAGPGMAYTPFLSGMGGRDMIFTIFVGPLPPAPEPEVDTAAPDTQITKRPKDKTKKKEATFEFTSSEPGSTFQCAVDGQTLKLACSSPYKVKVKKGKHDFRVQATDAFGNADPTPASDSWKVKKKKK